TKAQMTEAFPTWALGWEPEMLAASALAQIAAHGSDAFTRDIAVLLTKLSRLKIKDDCRPEIDGEFIGFGAVLSWRADDLTVRVYDDLINMAHQAEFCDVMGEVLFDSASRVRCGPGIARFPVASRQSASPISSSGGGPATT